mmetsp:Transcript_26327/g.67700  ORF Transcript_26327/g.67700 Transcript_26327/m.67700 type:complete len:231 (+) Transcript_26327:1397-2089(+)
MRSRAGGAPRRRAPGGAPAGVRLLQGAGPGRPAGGGQVGGGVHQRRLRQCPPHARGGAAGGGALQLRAAGGHLRAAARRAAAALLHGGRRPPGRVPAVRDGAPARRRARRGAAQPTGAVRPRHARLPGAPPLHAVAPPSAHAAPRRRRSHAEPHRGADLRGPQAHAQGARAREAVPAGHGHARFDREALAGRRGRRGARVQSAGAAGHPGGDRQAGRSAHGSRRAGGRRA